MAQVKVFYDRIVNTLVVWFGNSKDEYEVEETGNEVVLIKDKNGIVIDFEKLDFVPKLLESIRIVFEVFAVWLMNTDIEVILQKLRDLENEIRADLDTLEGLLG